MQQTQLSQKKKAKAISDRTRRAFLFTCCSRTESLTQGITMAATATKGASRRKLKLRKWVVTAAISGIVLVATLSIMVGVVVSNRKKRNTRQRKASLENRNDTATNATIDEVAPTTAVQTWSPYAFAQATSSPSITPFDVTEENDTPSNGTVAFPSMNSTAPSLNPNSTSANNSSLTNATNTISPSSIATNTTTETAMSAVPTAAPAMTSNVPSQVKQVSTPTSIPYTQSPVSLDQPTVTTFYVHGDIPYNSTQTEILEQQMKEVPNDAEFVVFVGDMRRAREDLVCVKEEYEVVGALFRMSRAPVFAIMGDNDWSDCPNQAEGLQLWRDEFAGFEGKSWNHTFDIKRQSGYPENFAFTHRGTLFIGLHIIGGDVYDATEWKTRLTVEAEWTIELIRTYQSTRSNVGRVVIFGHANPNERHDAFFKPLESFIETELQNKLPIAYICGDKHEWLLEPNYLGQPSWIRIMVTGLGVEPLLKVTIEANGKYDDPEKAFALDRRL